MKDILTVIRRRRSIREYTQEIPSDDIIEAILEAGRWAPSGLNNQPWRFVIIKDRRAIKELASYTRYSKILISAPVSIAVFIDNDKSYSRDKDLQAIGACIENMLLATEAMGLGACWLGEILNRKSDVAGYLKVPSGYELMAVLTLGYPKSRKESSRIPLSRLIYKKV